MNKKKFFIKKYKYEILFFFKQNQNTQGEHTQFNNVSQFLWKNILIDRVSMNKLVNLSK